MALDLNKVVGQVDELVERLREKGKDWNERLDTALDTLHSQSDSLEPLKEKIQVSRGKVTWLVAGIGQALNRSYPPPPPPPQFTVLATDGSHIDVDRHGPARCYLINIGSVSLSYGPEADAALSSQPKLYTDEEEQTLSDPKSNNEQTIEGPLLGIKRSVEEIQALLALTREAPSDRPILALSDGTLILWSLGGQAYPDFVREAFLEKGFLAALDSFKELNRDKKLALASYISHPRSTDVVNALRLGLCPYYPADCDLHCSAKKLYERECDGVAGIRDRDIYRRILAPGERSPVFASLSSVVEKHYGQHKIHFFYLNIGDELGRVEIPQWVAEDQELLDLTHALVLDQCRRGLGYPVALMEAHEQAVVSTLDRERFWRMVEEGMQQSGMAPVTSAKSKSKRSRWI